MASSTTIPKPNKKAKRTIVLSVNPENQSGMKAIKAESGTESPTKMASRTPIKNIKTITTKMNPKITVLTKSLMLLFTRSEVSAVTFTSKPCGKRSSLYLSNKASMRSDTAITFAPARFTTLRVTTDLPSKRAKSWRSSLLSRTSATSPKRTVAPVELRI